MKELLLKDYKPELECVRKLTEIKKARFPVIDIHTHLGKLGLGEEYQSKYDLKKYLDKLVKLNVKHIVNMDGLYQDDFDKMMKFTTNYNHYITTFMSIDFSNFGSKTFEEETTDHILACYHRGSRGIRLEHQISFTYKDKKGNYLRLDDERLKFIYKLARKFDIPVYIRVGDSKAYFKAINENNEQIETLINNPEQSHYNNGSPSFEELLEMQEAVIKGNKQTKFIVGHFGSYVEDLSYVAKQLDSCSNMFIDMAGCVAELGRIPYAARKFFIKYQNRILFGTDTTPLNDQDFITSIRFLETFDECFEHHRQGRWYIYGIELPNRVLKKVYYQNACLLLKIPNELLYINDMIIKDLKSNEE